MDEDFEDELMYFNLDEYFLNVAPCEGEWIETDDIVLDVEDYII